MSSFRISYRELSEIIIEAKRDVNLCCQAIEVANPNLTKELLQIFQRELQQHFMPRFSEKWLAVNRTRDRYFSKYKSWLENNLTVTNDSLKKRGRPEKEFAECCSRAKRYKIDNLCNQFSKGVITEAANKLNGELFRIFNILII